MNPEPAGRIAGRLGLGPIDQVAYVVEDLESALERYEPLFGPFQVADSPLESCTYRGRPVDCRLRLAVNRSGPLEIELIQVLEGEAPHSEHLRAHGEGLHHVRFRVENLDEKLEALGREGFETIFYKRFAPSLAFAYVETPEAIGRSVIELLEM
jgi:catechol 2,3-dioxygenase-like lactoylglutathione lyase family enzyme